MSKIQKDHLNRAAYVYVRQSSLAQVEQNLESQRRQYALAERAKDLGWQDIRVIDEDLGRSGSGRVERRGFEALLSEVCQGRAGAVFAIEASRFARNGHDWHRLLEFCQIVDTLIVDHDGVYDPKHPNDRLVLGLKGTMSEVELSMFRQRSQEAIRQKARRGEYFTRIAEGYLLGGSDRLEKDPDEQVQRSIGLVFEKFRELGSARQVYLWFRQEEIKLPKRAGKGAIEFVSATPWLVTRMLKDPIYAGAYTFGRTSQQVVLDKGRKRVMKRRYARPEEWDVLLQGHHEAFISWAEYLKNQETLMHNRNQLGETVRGAARAGKGLLAGLLLIEAPNGGALIVRDNSLEKGPKSENHKAAIAIGAEGVTHPTPEITLTNNNLRNDGDYETALLWNLTATPATLKGNQFSGSVIPLKDDGGLYSSIVRFGVDKAKQLRSVAARMKAAIMHWVQ
jgi:DNA invertase Pin-like site-specific DNA recombinase